jgi:transcriptional regulator with XRE-family HTH domain
MSNDSTSIASRIKSLRLAKKMRQAELDTIADLPRSTISKIENQKREASASEIIRISQALGVTLDVFVRGESSFVFEDEIRIVEALRELSFDDYKSILQMTEARLYFKAKYAPPNVKKELSTLVGCLTLLTQKDQRPRSQFSEVKRVRI